MTATLVTADRLLIGARGSTAPIELEEHLATHGPLVVPADDPHWSGAPLPGRRPIRAAGRGGAGFPSAAKWEALRQASRRPVVVVNAMEGEPASAKDRVLLSRAPHLVLDGAEAVAAAVHASEIVVCVPDHGGGPAAIVEGAIAERRRAGVSRRRVSVRRPPGRYVTGEESALAGWLNGVDRHSR